MHAGLWKEAQRYTAANVSASLGQVLVSSSWLFKNSVPQGRNIKLAFPQWWRQGKLVDNFKDIIRKVVKKLSHMCQGNGGIAFRCRHDFRGRVQWFNWYKQQRCQGGWRSQSRKSNKSNTQKIQNPDEQAQPRKRTKLNRKLSPNGYRRHVIGF